MDKTLLKIYATNGAPKSERQIKLLPKSFQNDYVKSLITQGFQLSQFEKELMRNDEGLMMTNYIQQAKHCIETQFCFLGINGFTLIPYEYKLPYIINLFKSVSTPSSQFLSELNNEDLFKYLDHITHASDDGKSELFLDDRYIKYSISQFMDSIDRRRVYNHYNEKLDNKESLNEIEYNLLIDSQQEIYDNYNK